MSGDRYLLPKSTEMPEMLLLVFPFFRNPRGIGVRKGPTRMFSFISESLSMGFWSIKIVS